MKENEVRELMRKKSEKKFIRIVEKEKSKVEKQNTNPLLNLHDSNLKISNG